MTLVLETPTLEAALDNYLHVMVRVRPWAKKASEEMLRPLNNWLDEQAGVLPVTALTPEVVGAYCSDVRLTVGARTDLRAALHDFARWLVISKVVAAHPLLNDQ